MEASWRKCSSCKAEIPFGATYWTCSVSTCNRKRTGLSFCSVGCWEAHLPIARHRESYAVESRAPTRAAWDAERSAAPEAAPKPRAAARRVVTTPAREPDTPRDILIVVSKLKAYVRARSGMNTSDGVMPALSDHLRRMCDAAIDSAARDGRKTVLDRDFDL
jgi:hypothetical protein